jgi:hypothetical protein
MEQPGIPFYLPSGCLELVAHKRAAPPPLGGLIQRSKQQQPTWAAAYQRRMSRWQFDGRLHLLILYRLARCRVPQVTSAIPPAVVEIPMRP